MFNSLKYAKILEDSGLPRNQAETHIQILSDVIGEEMATKEDLIGASNSLTNSFTSETTELKSEITKLFNELSSRVSSLETKVTYEFQNLEHRMTLKLGGLMAALLATGLTAAKLLFL